MIKKPKQFARRKLEQRAFTLFELLLVLLISVIVLAVAIPRIRLISKERGIRETARIVGSMITKASDEATINGTAGIVIRRNPNFHNGTKWYASTQLGILRAVPVYVGDQPYSRGATPPRGAFRISATEVCIPMPIEHEENPPVVAGDKIALNHSPVQFEIMEVNPVTFDGRPILVLKLNVNDGFYPSIPLKFKDVPFVIHRQPILRRSSIEELPNGHIIDLRFSGNIVFDMDAGLPFENYDVELIFDKFGYVVKTVYRELNAENVRTGEFKTQTPEAPTYLLVTATPRSAEVSPLRSSLAMWVAIKLQSTNPSVGYNVPQPQATVSMLETEGFVNVVNNARGVVDLGANP